MKKFKKILAVIAALSMLTLSFTACGDTENSESDGMEIITSENTDSADDNDETSADTETSAEDDNQTSESTDSVDSDDSNLSDTSVSESQKTNSDEDTDSDSNDNESSDDNNTGNNSSDNNSVNNNNNNNSGNDSSGADTPSEPKYKRSKAIWNDALVENRYENGSFLEVTFKIKDDAADGAYPVAVYMTDGASSELIEYTFDCVEGYVNVGSGSGTSGTAGNTPTLVVGSVNGNAGDTVIVPIDMANNPGIAALVIGVKYDSNALEIQDIQCVGDISEESEFMINLTVE